MSGIGRAAAHKSDQERKMVESSHERRSKRIKRSVLKDNGFESLDRSSDSFSLEECRGWVGREKVKKTITKMWRKL